MEKQFNLTLTNRWKATVLVIAIIVVGVSLLVGILNVFARYPVVGGLLGIMWLAGFVLLPERVAQYFGAELVTVVFDAAGMTVSYPVAGKVRHLLFTDIASYYAGLEFDFTIQPRQGNALTFHLNQKLHPQGIGPLVQMQHHFKQAIAEYQLRQPTSALIRRLHFFDRAWATFWLVFWATMLGWWGWWVWQQPIASEGQWGGLIFASLLWGLYALAWFHYRRKA